MTQRILFLLSATFFAQIALFANNETVLVNPIQDNVSVEISMHLEIDGTIKLYSLATDEINENESVKGKNFINWVLHPDKDFYIKVGEEVKEITPGNYKRLTRKYFKDRPELVKRIGKRGFRYKNLPSMIIYYNKMIAKEGGLTKSDIIAVY